MKDETGGKQVFLSEIAVSGFQGVENSDCSLLRKMLVCVCVCDYW
jgi:hypothetical protein